MSPQQIDWLRAELRRHAATAPFAASRRHAANTLQFVERVAAPWQRSTLEGHLTASAWVLDRSRNFAALIHHRKLDRWFQPGGHVEAHDESWFAASRREVVEETGLSRFVTNDSTASLFDVDVHPIPPRAGEPGHHHYDLRFLFVADVDAATAGALVVNAEESHDCRWFALTDLANDPAIEDSLRRMVQLSIAGASAAPQSSPAVRARESQEEL